MDMSPSKSLGFSGEFGNGGQEAFQFAQVFGLERLGDRRYRIHGFASPKISRRTSFVMNMTQELREFSHRLGRADLFLIEI
jgi:hypothetical protein